MGLLIWTASSVGAVFVAVASKVLADDVKELSPKITDRLVDAAVRSLPTELRDRYREEWQSDLREQPGVIMKLLGAVSLAIGVRCSRREWATTTAKVASKPVETTVFVSEIVSIHDSVLASVAVRDVESFALQNTSALNFLSDCSRDTQAGHQQSINNL